MDSDTAVKTRREVGFSDTLGPDVPTVGWYHNGRVTHRQPPGVSHAVCIRIEAERSLKRAVAAERERADALRQALMKCKTCALPTEVRDLVNAALRA